MEMEQNGRWLSWARLCSSTAHESHRPFCSISIIPPAPLPYKTGNFFFHFSNGSLIVVHLIYLPLGKVDAPFGAPTFYQRLVYSSAMAFAAAMAFS